MLDTLKGAGCAILFFGAAGWLAAVFAYGGIALLDRPLGLPTFLALWLLGAAAAPVMMWSVLRNETSVGGGGQEVMVPVVVLAPIVLTVAVLIALVVMLYRRPPDARGWCGFSKGRESNCMTEEQAVHFLLPPALDPEAEALAMAYAREMEAMIAALRIPFVPVAPSAAESGYTIAQLIGRARAAQIVTKETPPHDRNH